MPISVTPAKLEFNSAHQRERQLILQNLGAEEARIEITADNEAVTVTPHEATLSPNQTLQVAVRLNSAKKISTDVEIIQYPKDAAQLGIAAGIKIPLTARVDYGFNFAAVFPFVLALAVTSLLFWLKRKRLHSGART